MGKVEMVLAEAGLRRAQRNDTVGKRVEWN